MIYADERALKRAPFPLSDQARYSDGYACTSADLPLKVGAVSVVFFATVA